MLSIILLFNTYQVVFAWYGNYPYCKNVSGYRVLVVVPPELVLPVVPVPVVPLLVVPLLVVPLLVVPLLVVPLPEVVPEVPVLPDGRVAGVVVEPVPLGLVLVEPDVPELITLLVAL